MSRSAGLVLSAVAGVNAGHAFSTTERVVQCSLEEGLPVWPVSADEFSTDDDASFLQVDAPSRTNDLNWKGATTCGVRCFFEYLSHMWAGSRGCEQWHETGRVSALLQATASKVTLRSQIANGGEAIAVILSLLAVLFVLLVGLSCCRVQHVSGDGSDVEKKLAPHGSPPSRFTSSSARDRSPREHAESQRPKRAFSMTKIDDVPRGPTEQSGMKRVGPPPICPAAISMSQVDFSMPLANLAKDVGGGKIAIKCEGGAWPVVASVSTVHGGRRCLSLAQEGFENNPLVRILPSPQGPNKRTMEVYAKSSTLYGQLLGGNGDQQSSSVLLSSGRPVMLIEMDDPIEKSLRALSVDGKLLAQTQINRNDQLEGTGTWILHVKPGEDPLIMLGCMLALFVHTEDWGSTPSSAAVAAAESPHEHDSPEGFG